jgi:hypothetical protein
MIDERFQHADVRLMAIAAAHDKWQRYSRSTSATGGRRYAVRDPASPVKT